jgi:nicotinate-nucleotide pyrophosphorylase (carboxylating)
MNCLNVNTQNVRNRIRLKALEGEDSTNTLHPDVLAAIHRALAEDIGSGDVTTDSIIPADALIQGQIIAKQGGVVAGLEVVAGVFATVDAQIEFSPSVEEGARVEAGEILARVKGPARAVLTAERTALNFLGRMSGIATLTRQFVDAVAGTKAVILDTRKTAPGLRILDKLAVARGGGQNHRIGLYDMVLIKDNHIDFAGSLGQAVRRARAVHHDIELEVEARSLDDVRAALDLKVGRILLDNMPLDGIAAAVQMAGGRAKLEASGNVTLETVRAIAETGVDYISVGVLTHSAGTFDVSFDIIR